MLVELPGIDEYGIGVGTGIFVILVLLLAIDKGPWAF